MSKIVNTLLRSLQRVAAASHYKGKYQIASDLFQTLIGIDITVAQTQQRDELRELGLRPIEGILGTARM